MTEKVTIFRPDGGIVAKDIAASVQKKIYINDVKTPVDEGYIVEHELPSGIKRRLLITGLVVYSHGSELDHIEIEYIKE